MATIDKLYKSMGLPMNIKRGNPWPLDVSSLWYSYDEMKAYAEDAKGVAYVGQVLALVDEENNTATAYIIADATGTLKQVGAGPVVDNKTIFIDEESGELGLKDFEKRFYKYVPEEIDPETGNVLKEATYKLTEVDENNPNYCDVDGVLYNKDKTEILCYPCDHDEYLRQKYGYEKELYKDEVTPEYEKDIQTYVVPSSVKKIDEMCFNYANLRVIYLPEGLKTIETLSIFKLHERKNEWETTPSLVNIYSYKSDDVTDTHFTTQKTLGEVYKSLPDGLEYIGSDAFSYNQAMSYVYIPDSVKYIGHHAFWDTVYKEDGNLCGVTEINVEVNEETFENIEKGDDWKPKYDYLLFKKSIDVKYEAERISE